jgi:hypothetical protein
MLQRADDRRLRRGRHRLRTSPVRVAVAAALSFMGAAGCGDDDGKPINCTDAPVLRLAPLPDESIFVFDGPDAGCESLPISHLFRNEGTTPVSISRLRFDDDRFSARAGLPQTVEPGSTIAVVMEYDGAGAEPESTAELTLAGNDGCARAAVTGVSVPDGGLISTSASAIDFGDVPLGETRQRELEVLWQRADGEPAPLVSGFSTFAGLGFSVLSEPLVSYAPAPCELTTVEIAYTAPAEAQDTEDLLAWEVVSGGFRALLGVPLYARAVARSDERR